MLHDLAREETDPFGRDRVLSGVGDLECVPVGQRDGLEFLTVPPDRK